MEPFPVAGQALFYPHGDHLDDVAPGERDPFAQESDGFFFSPNLLGEIFDLGGAHDERGEIEAEGVFDFAALPSSGEAFAVGRITPDD